MPVRLHSVREFAQYTNDSMLVVANVSLGRREGDPDVSARSCDTNFPFGQVIMMTLLRRRA